MNNIGFSHGVTFKFLDPFSEQNIKLISSIHNETIEINFHKADQAEKLNKLLPLINDFHRISLHMPCDIRYRNDQNTKNVLDAAFNFYRGSKACLAVVHPDLVDDWLIFSDYPIVWAIENMDDRKTIFRFALDLHNFFHWHPEWSLVLDLGHCYANDKSMHLANHLIEGLGDRIKEIHISGYEKFHEPLFKTRQNIIISHCNRISVPIIIESVFDAPDDLLNEYEYIIKPRLSL